MDNLNELRIHLKRLVEDLDECNEDYARLKMKEGMKILDKKFDPDYGFSI